MDNVQQIVDTLQHMASGQAHVDGFITIIVPTMLIVYAAVTIGPYVVEKFCDFLDRVFRAILGG